MLVHYIKNRFLLKLIKNNLHNQESKPSDSLVQTVGVLVDESCFFEKETLVSEIIAHGINKNNIKVIVYKDKFNKTEETSKAIFGLKHLGWNTTLSNAELSNFVDERFDVLVSYYDVEKAFLLQLTQSSKAQFKVGFPSVDNRLNHLMIDTSVANHVVFVQELFKYLKVLKKI